jgi:hypothetical protein
MRLELGKSIGLRSEGSEFQDFWGFWEQREGWFEAEMPMEHHLEIDAVLGFLASLGMTPLRSTHAGRWNKGGDCQRSGILIALVETAAPPGSNPRASGSGA